MNEIAVQALCSLILVTEVFSRVEKTENERRGAVQGTAADSYFLLLHRKTSLLKCLQNYHHLLLFIFPLRNRRKPPTLR